jgi:CheY-like chemotaxis protein
MAVTAADSGHAALECLQRENHFDFALIARHLSDIDGGALARSIREDTMHRALPLIDLTVAYDSASAGESLFCAKLQKPLRQAQLHSAVKTALGSDPMRETGVFAVAALNTMLAAQYPLQVLVVDDNAVNRKVAELTLARLGYQPLVAEDGRQAVDQVAQAHAAGRRLDLVFMDVQMPVLDGLDATRIIKSAHGHAAPVIIAMTAGASVDDRSNCFYAGMDDFVSKPINLKEFQATIERWGSRLLRKGAPPAA